MNIHPTALISPEAQLGGDVTVSPYAIIEQNTQIGDGCEIGAYVVIRAGTIISANTKIHTGAVLGEPPQDMKYKGERSYLLIGENNSIREFVTIHRASGEEETTRIGNHNLLMAYSHIGHNVVIGDHILLANYAGVSGHCVIGDYVNIGGLAGLHQYVTIGTTAMVGGASKVVRDVPPYIIADGNPAQPRGLNVRGLQRQDLADQQITILKRAYRLLFRSELNVSDALQRILQDVEQTPQVQQLVEFMRRIEEGYRGRQADPH